MGTAVEWTRKTPWRQGNLLDDEAIKSLGLAHREYPDDTVVIVVSHDCDLVQLPDRDPKVEVIVGRRILQCDGNCTFAKSSRTLHLSFKISESFLAEFVITDKTSIDKRALVNFNPQEKTKLSYSGLIILQRWLAARYRRSAFPDEFENRLVHQTKLAERITKAVRRHGELITAIFFDIDDGENIARTDTNDVYVLDIVLLHATEPDYNSAESATNTVKDTIERDFKAKLYDSNTHNWNLIELRNIDVMSEEALTYRQSTLMKQWRLDYISLSADPQQPVLTD